MRKLRVFLVLLCFLCLITACGKDKNYESYFKVTYELEGGTYQNCTLPVECYYAFKSNGENYIANPLDLSGAKITKTGFSFTGWYQTKTVSGDNVTYSEPWDFEKDTVGSTDITLYAGWKKDISYTYTLVYIDAEGEHVLGSYEVEAGEKFNDYKKLTKNNPNLQTAIGYYNMDETPWDTEFSHPGGESDLDIKVLVKYIDGLYTLVSNASELQKAKNSDIYLLNDIDMQGATLGFDKYSGTIMGNGYTISNFKVKYDNTRNGLVDDLVQGSGKSLYISLFKELNNATIKDITFDNVTVDIVAALPQITNIYVSPIATTSKGATLDNVVMNIKYICSELPDGFDQEQNLTYVVSKASYLDDEANPSTYNEVTINVTTE